MAPLQMLYRQVEPSSATPDPDREDPFCALQSAAPDRTSPAFLILLSPVRRRFVVTPTRHVRSLVGLGPCTQWQPGLVMSVTACRAREPGVPLPMSE